MKFPNVILMCGVAFAAGMVVPFAFVDLNTGNRKVETVIDFSNAEPLKKMAWQEAPQPTFNTSVNKIRILKNSTASDFKSVHYSVPRPEFTGKQLGQSPASAEKIVENTASVSERKLIADIQTELVTRGYNPGVVDGKMGTRTRSAIEAFQRDNRLRETGNIDDALVETLNITTVAHSIVSERDMEIAESSNISENDLRPMAASTPSVPDRGVGKPIDLAFGSRASRTD